MGIEAIYPKPKTTTVNKEHYKYPYLLKDFRNDAGQVVIDRANKVWSTDITYIKLEYEEVYLNEYKNMKVLKKAIEKYMISYNTKRLHSAIGYKTPNEVYYQAINNSGSKGGKRLQKVS